MPVRSFENISEALDYINGKMVVRLGNPSESADACCAGILLPAHFLRDGLQSAELICGAPDFSGT
jgi:hypothetical protein